MSSGEMKAVTIPRPSASPVTVASAVKDAAEIPVTIDKPASDPPKTAQDEHRKMALAPTFDRLVEVNMALTTAVAPLPRAIDRLVRTLYVGQTLQLIVLLAMLYLILHRS